MMKCSICKVNIAVIFITKVIDGKQQPIGLCMPCAQKQGIAPLNQILQQTGMTQQDFENLNNQMMSLLENADMDNIAEAFIGDDGSGGNQLLRYFGKPVQDFSKEKDFRRETNTGDAGHDGVRVKSKKQAKRKFLDMYGTNLTERASKGEIDRIIGREKEIDRIIQILNRRAKNNPVLIGEPGVGKTAIAEGLAVRIANQQVPSKLFATEIYLLDLAAIVAGTQFRGQFEARMKSILKEARDNGNIILVIDELHNIVGAGDAEGGAMNAANILKPALARGEIQVIGATTLDEYRKHIEKDAALERRFQPITVEEPTVEDTVKILKGLRDKYEAHHKVAITDEAIDAAANLSHRYISDRFLPDKAIDLIDEAASRVRLRSSTAPKELKELEEKIKEIDTEKKTAINNQDFEKAASLRDEERKLSEELDRQKKLWAAQNARDIKIGYEDIADVVSQWTGIPVTKLQGDESERLLNMEEILHKRVIGQEPAVEALSKAIRRSRVGLKDPKKPIGSFIFLGPTGVGKTELSKALAEAMFGDEDAMIRVDMSEYMEKHSVSKMIGSPPGYVGFDDGGQLTEKIRRKPYSVILFDEIEKAHPDVFNILLQILDDGRLTDAKGRTVDFKNTVVIMTSNVGASTIKKQKTLGFKAGVSDEEKDEYEKMKENVLSELKRTFRPEFLNRIDEIIVFHSLNMDHIKEIVALMINNLSKRLDEMNIHIKVDEKAMDLLAQAGFDPVFGARPLQREIRRRIEDRLSEELLKGTIQKSDTIMITADDKELIFTNER